MAISEVYILYISYRRPTPLNTTQGCDTLHGVNKKDCKAWTEHALDGTVHTVAGDKISFHEYMAEKQTLLTTFISHAVIGANFMRTKVPLRFQ